jgi:hypothetical protein
VPNPIVAFMAAPQFEHVRALHTAVEVPGEPPYDRAHLKVFYPSGRPGSTQAERSSGMITAAPSVRPFSIAVFCNPVNIGPEFGRWVGIALAHAGFVTATFSWMSNVQGFDVMVPGIQSGPGTVAAITKGIARLNEQPGPLEGRLDLTQVVVGGHSAGGSIALMAADSATHPNVRAVFSMAGHNARPNAVGGAVESVRFDSLGAGGVPVMLIAGTNDGVIDRSRFRYGINPGEVWDPMRRTFEESLSELGGRHVFVRLDGANHFSFADPDDDVTVGRPFMDSPATTSGPVVRAWCARAIGTFCRTAVERPFPSVGELPDELDPVLVDPLVSEMLRR